MYFNRLFMFVSGITNCGKCKLILFILSRFMPVFIDINVHKINAIICDGIILLICLGVKKTIAKVSKPIKRDSLFVAKTDCGKTVSAFIIDEVVLCPKRGLSCKII